MLYLYKEISTPKSVKEFKGKYWFLSNFFPSPMIYEGFQYATLEHAYQAAKTNVERERKAIQNAHSPARAKRLGRTVTLIEGWDNKKNKVMLRLLRIKFSQPVLKTWLLKTGTMELVEGNTWNDEYWGVCNGVGKNHLGRLLMRVRKELRSHET